MPSSQQFCTFFLDGHFFGTPVPQVQEVIQYQAMTRVPLAPDVVSGLINLRGQIVSAIDLRKRLGLKDRPAGQLPMNVVVRTDEGAVSLLVDEIGDVIEVEEDMLESPPETLQGFAREVVRGVYKLSGRLLLALDIERVVDLSDLAKSKGPREF
ncbi:MAG TPA: chemotaxis protein CheW [Candidatus Dormibacteraeota bacterium]|nr:chemotaxis protein CheW [Candidatus Dormibacteraeota bacterium]